MPCNVLPNEFYCYNFCSLDTLNSFSSDIVLIDTTDTTNIWQVAHSYKPVFDSLESPFGLITDSLVNYPSNLRSSFILKIFEPSNHILLFEHKYDTDSLSDGGYLEYSVDNGSNWFRVNEYVQEFQCPEIIETLNIGSGVLHDTIPAFTGTSGDWVWTKIQWIWGFPLANGENTNRTSACWTDTLYVRFTFESDSINTGKAGWMIRNIVTGWADLGSSVNELETKPLKIYPNPSSDKVALELPQVLGQNSQVQVLDISGKVVAMLPLQKEIDISGLENGIYTVLIQTKKEVYRNLLIKN